MSAMVCTGHRGELVRLDDGDVLGQRPRLDGARHFVVQLARVRHARAVGGEPRILEQMLEPVAAQEALGHLRRRAAHRDPLAVRGPIAAARPGVARAAAVTAPQAAERRRIRPTAARAARTATRTATDRSPGRPAPCASRWRSANMMALLAYRPVTLSASGKARHDRRAVGLAVHLGEPAGRLDQRPESRPAAVGPGLAPAGNPEQDQARMARPQGLPVEPEALERARARTTP